MVFKFSQAQIQTCLESVFGEIIDRAKRTTIKKNFDEKSSGNALLAVPRGGQTFLPNRRNDDDHEAPNKEEPLRKFKPT